VLWQLFGSTNQLLAGLALLVVSLYLLQRGRPALPFLVPMVFMMLTTLVAMGVKLVSFARDGNLTLLVVGSAISLIAVWLVVEAILAVRRYARTPVVETLDVHLPGS
jgi:carbon starvation protein